MPKPFVIYCLTEAVSPLTHMQGVEGNEAVFRRQAVAFNGREVEVPTLSGAMLRSVLLRRPGFEWLIGEAGLGGLLTRPEAYFLMSGGADYQGGGRESLALITSLADACPLAGVLGGCTPGQIFAGSVNVDMGWLVCRENEDRLATFLPPGVGLPDGRALKPSAHFLARYTYYRHDHEAGLDGAYDPGTDAGVRRDAGGGPLPGERSDGKSASMPYGGECVIPGAQFAHRFVILHPTRLEVGAILFSLRVWAAWFARVGGQGGRGHGVVKTAFHFDREHELARGADDEYLAHVRARPGALADWLKAAFRPKAGEEAKPKGKAKGKGKAATVPAPEVPVE